MTTELLQQVRIIDPVTKTDEVTDVLIVDGFIQAVGNNLTNLPANTIVRDCLGLVLGTGLVDLYSHSGEPGFEERETLHSLLSAATAGGFTRICILPDTDPAIDNPAVVTQLLQRSEEIARWGDRQKNPPNPPILPSPHLHIWGSLTQNVAGKQMTELADLAASGIVGFADGQPIENLALVRRLLEYLRPFKKPIAFWACDRQLASNGAMREGPDSIRLGLPGNPAISETSALAALLELVAAIGTPIHIMRVSTARSVELIAQAKSRGLPVTASTTWMHLLLDTQSVKSYNTSLRLEPPLGNPSDLVALRQGVKSGVIDAIAIDHAAYTYEEKTQTFAESPPGAIGLELALPLLWQHLVESGELTALELWQALSNRPAESLGVKINAIAPDQVAELTLFDPKQNWKVDRQNLKTLSSNTPWFGQQLSGKVVRTWCHFSDTNKFFANGINGVSQNNNLTLGYPANANHTVLK